MKMFFYNLKVRLSIKYSIMSIMQKKDGDGEDREIEREREKMFIS